MVARLSSVPGPGKIVHASEPKEYGKEYGMIGFLRRIALIALAALLIVPLMGAGPPPVLPLSERVNFPSADRATTLVGYLFRPQGPHASRMPAVVMMHGRAGAYSSAAEGDYSAMTLSRRHQQWGHLWAQQGYLAVLVDGFGPRGYPHGFPRFSYDSRPDTLNEVTVRPKHRFLIVG
jgi:hypothetical protein